ncbi:MAG: glycoside hydrolase family 11 protein [Treponema sp.]|nr:glycoside hydrolase family 11 protein [Treponema sp.]
MKNKKLRQGILVMVLLFIMTITGCANSSAGNDRSVTYRSNRGGKYNGYDFEFWADNRGFANGRMTLTGNGSFYCEWLRPYKILFRMGKKYNETKTHSQIGTFALEYGISEFDTEGTAFISVYGWTVNPLAEFFIVENWGSNNDNGSRGTHKGTVTVGGDVYDVYENIRTNIQSIKGVRTFPQYWSIRQTRRSEGTVPVSEHFAAWEEIGFNMDGKMYEVSFCVEAYGGESKDASGSANIYKNKLTVNGVEINARK